MITYKHMIEIIKKISSITFCFLSVVLSLIFIGIIASITFFLLVEKSSQPCDNQFIQGCMAAGLSEQTCKNRLY